jgi:hypothetical protein
VSAVTEAEWHTCTDPQKMVEFLRLRGSSRKLRLFACACCRRIWHVLTADESRKAIEVAERYVDGSTTDAERRRARSAALDASKEILTSGGGDSAADMAASAACYAVESDEDFRSAPELDEFSAAWGAAYCAAQTAVYGVQRLPSRAAWTRLQNQARQVEQAVQAAFLRDIFGNPFRRVVMVAGRLIPTFQTQGQAAYDNRSLPAGTLEPDRLAALATPWKMWTVTTPSSTPTCASLDPMSEAAGHWT